jgi:hypothetical protein
VFLFVHVLVLAQVEMNPTSQGAPGAAIAQQAINWLGQYALWGSLAAILVGACTYGLSQRFGNSSYAVGGRILAIGGVVGAILTGLGPGIVNLLFKAASAG